MSTSRWCKLALWAAVVALGCLHSAAQQLSSYSRRAHTVHVPDQNAAELLAKARAQAGTLKPATAGSTTPLNAPWTPLGPDGIQTSAFGLVSGRVTSIAADPADASGNTVYVGTTGGGVWKSTNAAGTPASVSFQPLTDTLPVFSGGNTSSLSIGALSVQAGNTGVILAGTGDTNDATDSYYGAGILVSADHGITWSLVQYSSDGFHGGYENFSFLGEGIAGFAWSTANPQLVVAAATLSTASVAANAQGINSVAGLYYSTDAGKTWYLSTITDGANKVIQSPNQAFSSGNPGNSATSITWNPIRQRFYAAIRYHGYYESSDGITFTRLASQPGTSLSATQCPANPNSIGSSACPIFRGAIATQPVTGDMFAITVAAASPTSSVWQDQGLWQDACNSSGSGCAASEPSFSSQISDTPIDDASGNIPQGDYNLTLAAVPQQQDTLLFVGTQDIFRCSLANSCAWRNTTHVANTACAAAEVAPAQHTIDSTFGATGLLYFGNDGGLWRTTDDVNQQSQQCSTDDALHFQSLNSGLGSIAEVSSFSQDPTHPDTLLAAMGYFGTAAPQSGSTAWAQVLDGEGDYNAIDPADSQNWFATSGSPVSINTCPDGSSCTPSAFGSPIIGNLQVSSDGFGLLYPAPWILDPQNSANLILGTCRVWRGPSTNSGWTSDNAISPMLDTVQNPFCNGNAEIRSLAASGSPTDAPGTPEIIYAGMAGVYDGGATVAGHIYSASVGSNATTAPTWTDISNATVINSSSRFNPGGFPVSSLYVDPHDPTGNTLYATLEGFSSNVINGSLAYRTRDGGQSWIAITANLPSAPANSIVVDPNDANTVYIALDVGVFITRNINQCTDSAQQCWSLFGTGLPNAPVTQLLTLNYGSPSLRASTYGRGIWQIPLVTATTVPAAATLSPTSLTFASQRVNTASPAQTVTVTNSGSVALNITSITTTGDFTEQDTCTQPLAPAATCQVQVIFTPTQPTQRTGILTVFGNVPNGQTTASLAGTGVSAGNIVLNPTRLDFGNSPVGTTTPAQNITISNTGGSAESISAPATTGDFAISVNTCGTSLAPNSGCTISVTFTPTTAGARAGTFTIQDSIGTQVIQLTGNGQAQPTAVLSGASLSFSPPQTIGTVSAPQQVTLTNNGDLALTDIVVNVNNADFIAVNNCGASLIGHATCAISVTFAPQKVGLESGTLTLKTVLGTQAVSLSGTGVAPPGISSTPATLDFGSQGVGVASSPAQPITLTNNGGQQLTGLSFNASGDYSIASSDCPTSLGVGSACHVNLVFTPSQTGTRSGLLTATASNLSAPLNSILTGIGEDYHLNVIGSSTAAITSGQKATYTIQVDPVNGSSGSITLTCSGLPQNANATCTVNPTNMPLVSGVSGTVTVTIATGVIASSSLVGWKSATAFLAVLLPCFFFRKLRKERIWMIALAAVTLLLPAACGVHSTGGSTSQTPNPPSGPQGPTTPTGTYPITIMATTAASGGLQRSVSLSLTVQ